MLVLLLVPALSAQPQPRFASATIRPSTAPADARPVNRVTEDGGYLATNVTLKALINAAYRRSGFDQREIAGGPAWIDTDRFDVEARAPGGLVLDAGGFPRVTLQMLQELLKERFELRGGVEPQVRPVYALVPATGAPGPRLVKSSLDCVAAMRAFARGQRGGKLCGAAPYPGRLTGTGLTMADVAALMSQYLDRPVIDRSGLTGSFDVDLEGREFQPRGPFGPSYRPSSTKESVFDLIEPQLGLRLERTTGETEVLTVRSAARPRMPE